MYDQISLLYDIEQQQDKQLDIIKKKNSDYAKVNPFENFQVTAHFANLETKMLLCSTWQINLQGLKTY